VSGGGVLHDGTGHGTEPRGWSASVRVLGLLGEVKSLCRISCVVVVFFDLDVVLVLDT